MSAHRSLIITFLSVSLLFTPLCFAEKQEIIVVGNNAPPYRIFNDDKVTGAYFDLMEKVAKRMNLKVRYLQLPFKRALRSMEAGQADLMIGPNKSKARELYMKYTAPIGKIRKAFYVRQDRPTINHYKDLYKGSIGVKSGNVYFDRFDSDNALSKIESYSYEQSIRMVQYKRVNTAIMPEHEGDYLLKQLGANLRKSPYLEEGKQSYFAISRKSNFLKRTKELSDVISIIREEGGIKAIWAKYRLNSSDLIATL